MRRRLYEEDGNQVGFQVPSAEVKVKRKVRRSIREFLRGGVSHYRGECMYLEYRLAALFGQCAIARVAASMPKSPTRIR